MVSSPTNLGLNASEVGHGAEAPQIHNLSPEVDHAANAPQFYSQPEGLEVCIRSMELTHVLIIYRSTTVIMLHRSITIMELQKSQSIPMHPIR